MTNLTTETVQQGVPIFGATQTPPFGAFAVNQQNRSPYVQNFNINVQRELSRALLLQVGYVGNQGRKLPVNLEINQPLPDPTGKLTEQQRRPYNAAVSAVRRNHGPEGCRQFALQFHADLFA